jgi:hypothetical protein
VDIRRHRCVDALHGWPLMMLDILFWAILGFFGVILFRLFTETL